jgi:hypothetical protein
MPRTFRNAGRLLIATALIAGSACTDVRPPTAPPINRLGAAIPANAKIKITKLQTSTNTLRIDGPGATGTARVTASGVGSASDIVTHIEIAQPAAVQLGRPDTPLKCDGSQDGVLIDGNCDLSFDFAVKNENPQSGTLVPGAAVLRLYVMQLTPSGTVILASKEQAVNLVGTPRISSLALSTSYFVINGAPVNYTATLQNPANGLQGVALQAFFLQGETLRFRAGSSSPTPVTCGGPPGQLPNGSCTLTLPAVAANAGSGQGGPLKVGDAKLLVVMTQNGAPLDSTTRDDTLIPAAPHLLSVALTATSFTIGGSGVAYTAKLTNGGTSAAGISVQSYIEQSGTNVAQRAAGETLVSCGGAAGVLPTTTTTPCTVSTAASASNTNDGTGTLVAGPATLVVRLRQGTTVLESSSFDITLVAPESAPTITNINLPTPTLVLGGPAQNGAVSIKNSGPPVSKVLIQEWVSQPTGARYAAGGGEVICPDAMPPVPPGTLPTGTCLDAISVTASNTANGNGTLVPGAATLEIELKIDGVIIETKSIPVTIVSPTPSIVSIAVSTEPIPIFSVSPYTVTISNPTSITVTGDVSVQGYVEQQSGAISWPTGGTSIVCSGAAAGTLPPGVCVFQSNINLFNPNQAPPLSAGPATFRLMLYHVVDEHTVTIDEKSVPITLSSPPSP